MCNMIALSLLVRKLWPRLMFLKSRSNFKVKVVRSKIKVPYEGLATRNTHVQYESFISSCKKVMAKVKVFVHVSNADAETRAMTLAPRTHSSRLANNIGILLYLFSICICV